MENIKFETDLRLETILLSINLENVSSLSVLEDVPEIDINEKSIIRKYVYLIEQLKGVPSYDILKKEFPSLYFDGVEPLAKDELEDYITLYISNKKNLFASKKLMDLASIVRTNGITEEIVLQLNNITKSDAVKIAHEDISGKLLDIYNRKVDMSGISTGIKKIDEDTGGLQPGTITTILGFTGSYKTTWALNIAYNAMVEGKNVCYLSLEVTDENIFFNMVSRHSFNDEFSVHLEHLNLKHRKLKPREYELFEKEVLPSLNKLPGKLYVIDEKELESYSFFSLENKFREIDKLAIEQTGHGIDLLVVDHAQLLKFDASMKSVGNETNVINAYVSFFRQSVLNWIKSGRQIAGLILSQSSREGWKEAVRAEGRYRLTALAEANELERASSLVLSVFSSDSLKQIKEAKVQILKNRDGQAWSEPAEIFVDPVYYAFGDIKGSIATNIEFNSDNISDLFAMDDSSLEQLNNIATMDTVENIDLDL